MLTSRLAVADIQRFKDGAAPVVDVERLSDEAGAELLRDNDVWGMDRELKAASHDFGGHPLALTLLASLIKETQNGDVRRRDHIRGLLADADNPRHDQARRVMESYEKEWLAGQPILLAILHCVGLFDRPASGDCLKALRAKPAIPGLTDALVGLSDDQWRRAVARLREARLLAPVDPSDPEALDAHPLVREWFGERLRQTNEAAWKAAHSRLYDHLRDTTREGQTPTLADLAPLYHAVAHGCRAGRHQEALDEVYMNRICRRLPDGRIEFYAVNKLGAVGSNLAAISWFFDRPYETPVAALTPRTALGSSARPASDCARKGVSRRRCRRCARRCKCAKRRRIGKTRRFGASNLSETELLVGEIAAAVTTAEKSVALADRSRRCISDDGAIARPTPTRSTPPASGKRPRISSPTPSGGSGNGSRNTLCCIRLQGYRYCDLLLSQGRAAEARDRAAQTLEWARRQQLGSRYRARYSDSRPRPSRPGAAEPGERAFGRDRRAPMRAPRPPRSIRPSKACAPPGKTTTSLAACSPAPPSAAPSATGTARRATSTRSRKSPSRAQCGSISAICALERARLALARREAFAPLNGLVEPSPPPPALPDAAEAARLLEEARKELDAARKLIAECGYHRRDEELAELDAVVAGRRRFADLPPRV